MQIVTFNKDDFMPISPRLYVHAHAFSNNPICKKCLGNIGMCKAWREGISQNVESLIDNL